MTVRELDNNFLFTILGIICLVMCAVDLSPVNNSKVLNMHLPNLVFSKKHGFIIDFTNVSMIWSPNTLFSIAFYLWLFGFGLSALHALITYETAHGLSADKHALFVKRKKVLPRNFIKLCMKAKLRAQRFYRQSKRN